MIIEKPTPVLYLDIDGTVRQGKDDALGRFVNSPEDVVVFPEAVEMMRRWKQAGGRIIGVSNQGGIALGIVTVEAVTAAMAETHRQADNLFDKLAWCAHHPHAAHPEMARCWCRKPSPGLLIEAALDLAHHHREIYPPYMALMVGDRAEDEQCARIAGIDFQTAAEWRAAALDGNTPAEEKLDDADGSVTDKTIWCCRQCGSTRWVAASLTGPVSYGGTAIKQCVPCGHYSADSVDGGETQ